MNPNYNCSIKSEWQDNTEFFRLVIKYFNETYVDELFTSPTVASQFATDWYLDNTNDTDTQCSETS